ncbi:MAG TPA: hypothetical protein DHV25_03350 [Candidatus Kerfeldbacteria bacterium]|nr:hypothetical protein [Candidatus Kerfeldbacteria bacterium]
MRVANVSIQIQPGESIEDALRRFNRGVVQANIPSCNKKGKKPKNGGRFSHVSPPNIHDSVP